MKGGVKLQEINDKDCFDEIYKKYVATVYRVCFLMLKNSHDAEDTVQTVFTKFIEKSPPIYTEEQIKAWLIVTAKNTCKNHLKYWWNKERTEFPTEYITKGESNENSIVLESVLSLNPKFKLPIYLYYFEGYKTKEIAKLLGINESTLRSRLKFGREKLKLLIGGDEDYE